MEPSQIVQAWWERIGARDWAGAGELLADDLVVEWPVSRERIVGRENFISVQAEYPEGWSIRVLRVLADGESIVSEVEVPHEEMGVFRAVSVWTVSDGVIVAGREYWTEFGADPSPEWRAKYVVRY
jgi:ketosteroid isomerase-like protein